MVTQKKIRRTVSLDKDVVHKIDKIAEKDKRSFSNIIVVLLDKFLNDCKK